VTDPIDDRAPDSGQPFREDLLQLYRLMRPSTIACVNVTDPSCLPLDAFLSGTSRVWMVDWEAGRPERAVARQLVRRPPAGSHVCLASEQGARGRVLCSSYLPILGNDVCARFKASSDVSPQCQNYTLGQEPRVEINDGSLGRAAYFATRVEEVVAVSDTPVEAVERALVECQRAGKMDETADIPGDSIELVISVLPPNHRVDGPFDRFDSFMRRRFGAWTERAPRLLIRKIDDLRAELFGMQLDAHVRELHRLVDKHVGGLYFATHPVTPAADGSWSMPQGLPLALEILTHYFDFDFESFPAEAFLRRDPHDKSRVVQATLLRPRPWPINSTAAPRTGEVR